MQGHRVVVQGHKVVVVVEMMRMVLVVLGTVGVEVVIEVVVVEFLKMRNYFIIQATAGLKS